MATVNEDAEGSYSCTPYNSYGTMGPSGPTRVVLQDPPSFSITPAEEYRRDAGRTLLIPCQGNAAAAATWSKVDPVRSVSYSIEPNGSLLLQPLLKDHQGEWECSVSNRAASLETRTRVFVLGTSPHAAAALAVSPGPSRANLSWEAGFDGGSAQTFSVWVKRISASGGDGRQEWSSVPVPASSGTSLQVLGLSPATDYQFSVLSQNKFGTGPFSEIVTARTLDPQERSVRPKPPASLSANQSSAGVILQWALPDAQQPPITGFVLQSRSATAAEDWFNLEENINASSSHFLVRSLQKDRVYELRMLSRRGELLSEPGPSVNVSTAVTESFAATSTFVPEPLLAGVLAGIGFMFLALVLLLGSACLVNRRRDRRHRKTENEPLPAIYKCSPSIKTSGSSSPDSLLKKSLLPASSHYPTMSFTTSSSQTDCSTLSTENNHRRKTLEPTYSRSRLTKTTSLISPSIELISRGPDGRFAVGDYDTLSVNNRTISRAKRSVSLHLEKEDKKDLPRVLSVDVPSFKLEGDLSQIRSLGQLPPLQENYIVSPDQNSLYSNTSFCTMPCLSRNTGLPPVFPVLPHLRASIGQPSTTASSLVLQMEHEREKGNLSRCLRLAQEREEMERELRLYTLDRNSMKVKTEQRETSNGDESVESLMWEYKSRTLPNIYRGKERSRYLTSSSTNWEAHPYDSSSTLNPIRDNLNTSPPSIPSFSPYFLELFTKKPNGVRHSFVDSSTLPHQRCRVDPPQGYDSPRRFSSFDPQTSDSFHSPQKENNLSNGTMFHNNRNTPDTVRDSTRLDEMLSEPIGSVGKESYVEMSVDEPEYELPTLQPVKPMLHHRIASHVQHGCSLSQRSRHEDMRRSTSLNCSRNASVSSFDMAHHGQQTSGPEHWRARTQGSKTLDRSQRSQSLDLRKQKKSTFLTPSAWVESLSQEDCSIELSHKSTKTEQHFSTAAGPTRSPNPDVPHCRQPSPSAYTANHPTPNQDTMKESGYIVSLKEVSTYLPPISNDLEALEVDSGGYEEVADSGGSYNSYASSGRGSMETANGHLPLSQLSPVLTDSPATAEDTRGGSEHKEGGQTEPKRRRQCSVDENYEWDAGDVCSRPGEQDGVLPPQKPAANRSRPSMPRCEKAQKRSPAFASLPGHQSRRSAEPEPDAVLF
uniref:Protein turtle homolog A-like n=2 Tax=Poecilia reticulata TaxID=8081 RepID=A0A3P9QEY0_POERE